MLPTVILVILKEPRVAELEIKFELTFQYPDMFTYIKLLKKKLLKKV
jgi:hypothetical protein